jgi:L-ascorbate metabolism protein UlaG (beta-lactamase superfamily)
MHPTICTPSVKELGTKGVDTPEGGTIRGMVITHHGGQCFKVTLGDLTLVFDPISKNGTVPAVRFGADIALVSRDHPDMNGVAEVTYGEKEPFAITGPGEYELAGVTIRGFRSASKYGLPQGTDEAVNTIYAVQMEDMALVHLGALADTELPPEAREALDEIDVLFVPIGGGGVLTPAAAHELAVALEPKIIVPMHWSSMGEGKALDSFLKEAGNGSEKLDKLTLKKRDLAGREGSILVLTP